MANTSSRTLRLLSLLQTHRFWSGEKLAGRLEVSERTLRRDIERLRDLGYPVRSTRGTDGGYQLAAGGAMPPLVVDEDEAIALVVALGGSASVYAGTLAESSLSALAKVMQVLPARLRHRAESLRTATVESPFSQAPEVEAGVLATVAQTIRDHERLRFSYTARGGAEPGQSRERYVEPHQLVTVGRRWYLLAFDVERDDWRSFRLDRLSDPAGSKWTFRPREVPGGDAAAYVRAGLSRGERHRVVVEVEASREHVEGRIGPWSRVLEERDGRCLLEIEAPNPRWVAFGLGVLEAPVTLVEVPDQVTETLREWGDRLSRMSA